MNSGDRIISVKGIGSKTAEHLARLGIETVGDFLEHYPRDYRRYQEPVSIASMESDDLEQTAYKVSVTEAPQLVKRGRTTIVSLVLRENTTAVQVVWYHSPYIRQQLRVGQTVVLYGKIIRKGRKRMLEHPDIYTEEQYSSMRRSLQPVYALTEGLSQNFFIKTMHLILDEDVLMPDYLPSDIRKKYRLSEYNYALQQIHFPKDEENCRMARRRLVFDEF
ncbi:MAG: ATP-dependent DNA helicase RecG, partial [Coprococcus sp.]